MGHHEPDSPHPVLRTPLGYAATSMLQALGLNGQQVHLATLQQPGNKACHDYQPHEGDYPTRLALVQQDQAKHWSAFFRANGGPKNEHVVASTVVQLDFDALPTADHPAKLQALVDAGLPAPTLALCTGSGTSLHVYWRLQHPLPIADGDRQVETLQKLICRHFDGDMHCTNPARMMRLAGGTYYSKDNGAPVGTAYVTWHDAANPNGYPFDTLWQWGQANQLPTRPATPYDPNEYARLVAAHANPNGSKGESGSDEVYRVNGSLALVDPDPYDDWIKVGMILHWNGYPLDTWDSWAKGSPKYNGYEGHEQKWRGFGKYKGKPLSIGTLVEMARRPGSGDPNWLRPSPGNATLRELRQAAVNALQDALQPPAPGAAPVPTPTQPQTTADALVARAKALRNHKTEDDTPIPDAAAQWPGLLAAVGQLQATRPPGITPMQVEAIIEYAGQSGIRGPVATSQIKLARDDAQHQLARQRSEQQAQDRLENRCPEHLQMLGLDPNNHIRLLDNRNDTLHKLSQAQWQGGWRPFVDDTWLARNYPGTNGSGHDPGACYSAMHRLALPLGTFADNEMRRLGVHLEGEDAATGTIVWNTGRGLVVSHPGGTTEQVDHADHEGDNRYINAKHSNLPPGTQPLTDAQGLHLLRLLQVPGLWGGPNDATLLFGWGVLAPMGEALPKRPQLAITGGTSKGKTWTRDNVLRPMVGGRHACHMSNAPTEAGLRALMATSTLPHLVDEQEARKHCEDMERLQRAAYDGGMYLLGGQGGGPGQQQYVCAALCTLGINQATRNQANELRRITVARENLPPAQFLTVAQAVADAYTVPTGQALVLRTFNNLRNTLANVAAFMAALAPHYSEEAATRYLETHALCLAFANSATTTATLDAAAATAWLQQVGWDFGEFAAGGDAQQQEGLTMLRTLLATRVTLPLYLPGQDHPTSQVRPLRALLDMAQQSEAPLPAANLMAGLRPTQDDSSDNGRNAQLARQHLAETWGLYLLANTHGAHLLWATGNRGDTRQDYLERHHSGYKWAKGTDAVARLRDLGLTAGVHKLPTLYGKNISVRGVAIPLALLDDAQPDPGDAQPSPDDAQGDPPPLW
jgi:hypothetical protein